MLIKNKNKIRQNALGVSFFFFLYTGSAHALELIAGDYELLPPGATVVLQYLQHAERSENYVDGHKAQSDFDLKSDIGITRFIHVIKLNDRAHFNANLLVPYGRLEGSDQAEFLGKQSGMSDVITGGAFEFLLNDDHLDTFGVGTFFYLPTGHYDRDSPITIGENRWKALLQLVYTKHFNSSWALDLSGDALIYGKNDDFGASSLELKQKPRYELQAHVRYNIVPSTALTLGAGYILGAESKIEGELQDDELKTTYGRLGVTHWINPTNQLSVQVGQDFDVENGTKEDARLNVRFAHVF